MATNDNGMIQPLDVNDPLCSSDSIWYKDNEYVSVSDKFDEVEAAIATKANEGHTHTGYADADHTHAGYAVANHTHDYAPSAHNHSYNDLSDKPTIPSAYTHPGSHPASMITGLADVATSGSYNDLSDKPTIPTIPSSLPANGGNADTVDGKHSTDFATSEHTHTAAQVGAAAASHTHDYAASSHTHTPASIGAAAASHTHSYAATNHNHDSEYIDKSLQFTSDEGSFKMSYKVADGKNVLTEMAAYAIGLYTIYSQSGTTGNPKTTEAWRMLFHKTGTTNGWVIAFGSIGSVYSNYLDGNSWRGWKCLVDSTPAALWSGQYYMSSNDGTPQTIYPSKKLSECRTGWCLVWSDYDPGDGANNTDLHHDYVYKRNVAGANWSGQCMLCDIPRYVGSNPDDVDTERRIIKPIYIHDNRIEGSYQNASDERNDVVLRAVYEF